MIKKIRAVAVVGASWASMWAISGSALNAVRFFLHARQLGLTWSVGNVWPWIRVGMEVGGSCGYAAGVIFGVMLTVAPRLIGSGISRRWSLGYGLASGAAASVYILRIGYGTMMIPYFAATFAVTGALTALAIAEIAKREPAKGEALIA